MTASWQTDGRTISRAARPGDLVYVDLVGERGQVVAVYHHYVTARICFYLRDEFGTRCNPKGETLWYLCSLGRAD